MNRALILVLLAGCSTGEPKSICEENPWKLTFSRIIDSSSAEKLKVMVVMERFHPQLGHIVKKHWHEPGERIGWWSERSGEAPVSHHPVNLPGGVTAAVDFDTGLTLASVEAKTVIKDLTRCKAIFNGGGTWAGCEQVQERRTFSTPEVVIRGSGGEQRFLVPVPDLSQSCPIHSPKQPRLEYTEDQKARMARWVGSAPSDVCPRYIRPLLERKNIPYLPWQKSHGITELGTDTPENARRARALVLADSKERGYTFYMGFDPPSPDKE